jgi:tetratricopeptide (TPR) repeat protein
MKSPATHDTASAADLARRLYAEGVALWNRGREAEGVARLDEALRVRPDFAEALNMGAYILDRRGAREAALQFYQRALRLEPTLHSAWSNLGKLMFRLGRFEEALAAADMGLRLRPRDADLHNTRAGALRALGRLEESAAVAEAALEFRPVFAEAALNLGAAHLKLDRAEPALAAFRRAQAARPGYADALCGEALALRALDRLDEARAAFEAAERLGSREAISGKGCLDLMLGDFERGWEGYEKRWLAGRSLAEALGARFPLWAGPGRDGERVLVLNDHGLGDTIQFCRYLPMMARAGANVTFAVPTRMHRLLRSGVEARLFDAPPEGETFDSQIAVSSLPRAFRTRLESVPTTVPYLFAEPDRVDAWARAIGPNGFKIGVVWQGNPNPEADMARSFPLAALAPLAGIEGARLISLQKGFGEEQLRAPSLGFRVETLGEEFDAGHDAFVDAAAVISHLDLVVTCDTSIAHLAGALARPVWVALKKDAEWRWLREREDSPWYPTMRLFRQPTTGDWASVFGAMADRPRRWARSER